MTDPVTDAEIYEMWEELNNQSEVARRMGKPRQTVQDALKRHKARMEADADAGNIKVLRLQQQLSDTKRELKKARTYQMQAEDVKEFIIGIDKSVLRNDEFQILHRDQSRQGIVPHIMLSDLHFEETIDPRQVRGLNEYNPDIAEERVEYTINSFIDIAKNNFNHGGYEEVYLHLNGDLCSGTIHDELLETNALPPLVAAIRVQQLMIRVINTLKREFGKVYVVSSHGNHSRLNKKYQHKNQSFNNLDWQIGAQIQLWFAGDDDVNVIVAESHDIPFTVHKTKYLQGHGDQFRGGQGFIGALAPISRGEQKSHMAANSYGAGYDKLLLGHWHQAMSLPRVIVNGSVVGYNEYAINCLFPYSPPQQVMWFTHPTLGCVSVINVNCVPEEQIMSRRDF